MSKENTRLRTHHDADFGVGPALSNNLGREAYEPFATREAEAAAFTRLRALRTDAWVAILAEPRRALPAIEVRPAPTVRRDSHDEATPAMPVAPAPDHATLITWKAARRLIMSRCDPNRRERAAIATASEALAAHLAASDKDDAHLDAVAAHVASHALPGMPWATSTVVVTWTTQVAQALATYRKAVTDTMGHNLKLVVTLAKRCTAWPDARCFTLDDLVGYGITGLRTGVLRFDFTLGYRFSTFAAWWIRHAVSRAIQDHGRFIRVPVHALDNLNKVKVAAGKLGPGATSEAIASMIGISAARVEKIRIAAATSARAPLSLDAPVRVDGNDTGDCVETFGNFLADDAPLPGEALTAEMALARLDALLAELKPQERYVIERRWGIGKGAEPSTRVNAPKAKYAADLSDIGVDLGVSRERVRQIQNHALAKMRARAMAGGMASAAG